MRAAPLIALVAWALSGCSSSAPGGTLPIDDASTITPPGGDAGATDASATDVGATDASGSVDSASRGSSDATTPPPTDAGSDATSCAGCARDWGQFPAIAQLDGVSELWVLSDAHGDYAALTQLLTGGGILAAAPDVPAHARWSAGRAALVVVGDLIDKGPDAPDVVRLMIALSASASAAGGHVVVTMGNHEAEFLADPNNSKATATDGIDPELTAIGLTPAQTAAGNDDIGLFVRDLPFAARVDGWFFVHGGDTGGRTLAQLDGDLRSGIDASGFGATVLSDPASMLEARLSKTGPQWWDATGDAQTLLSQWTAALGCSHLVMGHQPGVVAFADGTTRSRDVMTQAYGGLLFLVDTGMSVDVDATGGALLHVLGAGSASESWQEVLPNGTTQSL